MHHLRYLCFRIVLAFSCGQVKNNLKKLRADANFFENGDKKLRFQTGKRILVDGALEKYYVPKIAKFAAARFFTWLKNVNNVSQ